MSKKKPKPKAVKKKTAKKLPGKRTESPDWRGNRPSDPNQFAKWIVDQTTNIDGPPKDGAGPS